MMALTPKRLFLYLCISISLLRPYTLFSRSPLVNKTLFFHSSACISSSEGFFKNRSAHFCGKSPSSGACPSQIALLFSLGLKFLMKWKPTLHLWRPEFLRLPAGFRKPFQLAETRGFADHFLKISRSYTSGNLNYSNFPRAEQSGQLWCLAPYHD